MPSIFRDKLVLSAIPAYFKNTVLEPIMVMGDIWYDMTNTIIIVCLSFSF